MNETKWMPGPWKAGESGAGVLDHVWYGARDIPTNRICEMIGQGHGKYDYRVTNANAQLLAAAPELYEALEALANYEWVDDGGHSILRLQGLAHAALAKARGESE